MELLTQSFEMQTGQRKRNTSHGIDFTLLPVGKSVTVKIEDVNENVLRTTVCQMSKRLGRVFRCIKHSELGLFEIGRLPDKI